MQTLTRKNFSGVATAAALSLTLWCAAAPLADAQNNYFAGSAYSEVRLVSDTAAGLGAKTDPNLGNPWGLAAIAGNPWWVADNHTGLSTLYDGQGNIQGLVVTIPPAPSAPPDSIGNPTGIVANATTDFGGAPFIFDSEDGSISTWSGGPSAVVKVDKGSAAIYKGLTIAQMGSVNLLYAANFHAGTVDVYDTNFNPVTLLTGAFQDPALPSGFAPFNVQAVNGNIIVCFAKQDSEQSDEVHGPGLGFVDEFDSSGNLMKRFQHGAYLDAPWGVALAPDDFGLFSNDLLVGNFGNGGIIAFNPVTGRIDGILRFANKKAIQIPGLWALSFGLGGSTGPTNWLYFTAGIQDEAHGVFGYITAP